MLRLPENQGGREVPEETMPAFSPNVIRGDFTPKIPGVRAANDATAIQLPLYGRIAAGLPIEAMQDPSSYVDMPVHLLGNGEHYALEVAGDSMVEAGILDGDTVVIRKGDVAETGQIVVALVDDSEVTLKRLRRRGNSIAPTRFLPCCFCFHRRAPIMREGHQGMSKAASTPGNLKAIAAHQLRTAGVTTVMDIGICTICADPGLLFSHRRDRGVTGRQAGIAWRS